jgi:murein DD-endopeptidase MepM/ murein hydrolase activator NlpD
MVRKRKGSESMYPRYKKSRKYKLKAPKEKMSFQRKTAIQALSSAIIFIFLFAFSFFSFSKHVSPLLTNSYSRDDWQESFSVMAKRGKKLLAEYFLFMGHAKSSLGISEIKNKPALAKSENSAKNHKEDTQNAQEVLEPLLWSMPTEGHITDPFGKRIHPISKEESFHTGIDIAGSMGQDITAAAKGVVSAVGCDNANGNYIVLAHEGNIQSVYAHLSEICVKIGDEVSHLTKIGKVGDSGITTGPHLHFEIKLGGESVNPEDYVRGDTLETLP